MRRELILIGMSSLRCYLVNVAGPAAPVVRGGVVQVAACSGSPAAGSGAGFSLIRQHRADAGLGWLTTSPESLLSVLRCPAPLGSRDAPRERPAPAKKGWGRTVLAASASRAGTAWTDHGIARQERGLKHRAAHETRTIPSRPSL
jgi:hypothetical protein